MTYLDSGLKFLALSKPITIVILSFKLIKTVVNPKNYIKSYKLYKLLIFDYPYQNFINIMLNNY